MIFPCGCHRTPANTYRETRKRENYHRKRINVSRRPFGPCLLHETWKGDNHA